MEGGKEEGDRGEKGEEERNEKGREKQRGKEGRGREKKGTWSQMHISKLLRSMGHCDFIAYRSQDGFIEKKQETFVPPGTSHLSHRHKVIEAPPDPRCDGGPPATCQ